LVDSWPQAEKAKGFLQGYLAAISHSVRDFDDVD
jgi:hypothetical protein